MVKPKFSVGDTVRFGDMRGIVVKVLEDVQPPPNPNDPATFYEVEIIYPPGSREAEFWSGLGRQTVMWWEYHLTRVYDLPH